MYSYADMHCDSLLRTLTEGADSLFDGAGMQSIQKMAETGQWCQFFAIFFRPQWQGRETELFYFERLRRALLEQLEKHSELIALAHNYAQIQANRELGKASAIVTIEDGRMVGGQMEQLQALYEKDVRAITLTWNQENCFGYPHARDTRLMKRGLTAFGKEAIGEMNRLGILIDVSHLSDGGFYDVAALSDKPFVASHSNCRALVPHSRNLSNDMIALLAERGGVAGVNMCPAFVQGEAGARDYIEALAEHVLHFIAVGGEECVGLGTDFDGFEERCEVDCPRKLELLFAELKHRGMTDGQLDKFVTGNVLRVVKDTMK